MDNEIFYKINAQSTGVCFNVVNWYTQKTFADACMLVFPHSLPVFDPCLHTCYFSFLNPSLISRLSGATLEHSYVASFLMIYGFIFID